MSTDEKVASQIKKTLEDGKLGFEKAAEKATDAGRGDLAEKFRGFAGERATLAKDLEVLAAKYGDDIDDGSSVTAAVHRGWMAIKDAFTGDDAEAIVKTALQGEEHAVNEYKEAMESDISPSFREVLAKQLVTVQAAHDFVKSQAK